MRWLVLETCLVLQDFNIPLSFLLSRARITRPPLLPNILRNTTPPSHYRLPPPPPPPQTLQHHPNRPPNHHRHHSTNPLRHRPALKRRRRRGRRPHGASRVGSGVRGLGAAEGEVRAGQARGVGGVDYDAAVAEEGGGAGGGGEVEV